jgi:hypothetical protein
MEMKRYTIVITAEAKADIEAFYHLICHEYKQPLTARRNRVGVYKKIKHLASYAGSIAFSQYEFIQRNYGFNARHITYKKMTIIYLIEGDYLFIRRVIPSSAIY